MQTIGVGGAAVAAAIVGLVVLAIYWMFVRRAAGKVIASAEETLSAEAAAPRHARPLGLAPGTPVMVIERLARGYDGKPLEWRRSRGPADKFRYQVEIR